MKEYKRLTARETALRLKEIKNPAVLIHIRPDGDAVGTAAALCEVFAQLGTSAYILTPQKIPDRLLFIIEHTGACVRDEACGESSVSVDSASPSQLDILYDTAPRPQLMIDHHMVGEQYADGYIRPDASSAAEALADVIDELIALGLVKMNEKIAYALYSAISSDTGRFAFSNASAKTYSLAARLIENGINTADINAKLFFSKSKEQMRAEGFVASGIETRANGKIGFCAVTLADINALGIEAEHLDSAIDVVRSLAGVEIAFTAKETEPRKYKISLRSTGANVAAVAAELGGGGHVRAAGCSIIADSAEKACSVILEKIEALA